MKKSLKFGAATYNKRVTMKQGYEQSKAQALRNRCSEAKNHATELKKKSLENVIKSTTMHK